MRRTLTAAGSVATLLIAGCSSKAASSSADPNQILDNLRPDLQAAVQAAVPGETVHDDKDSAIDDGTWCGQANIVSDTPNNSKVTLGETLWARWHTGDHPIADVQAKAVAALSARGWKAGTPVANPAGPGLNYTTIDVPLTKSGSQKISITMVVTKDTSVAGAKDGIDASTKTPCLPNPAKSGH